MGAAWWRVWPNILSLNTDSSRVVSKQYTAVQPYTYKRTMQLDELGFQLSGPSVTIRSNLQHTTVCVNVCLVWWTII